MLPALFDWSIIGCTILRLALINLEQNKQLLAIKIATHGIKKSTEKKYTYLRDILYGNTKAV